MENYKFSKKKLKNAFSHLTVKDKDLKDSLFLFGVEKAFRSIII